MTWLGIGDNPWGFISPCPAAQERRAVADRLPQLRAVENTGSLRRGGFFFNHSTLKRRFASPQRFLTCLGKMQGIGREADFPPFPGGKLFFFSPCPPSSKLKIRVSGNQTASKKKTLFSKMNRIQNSRYLFSLLKIFLFGFKWRTVLFEVLQYFLNVFAFVMKWS